MQTIATNRLSNLLKIDDSPTLQGVSKMLCDSNREANEQQQNLIILINVNHQLFAMCVFFLTKLQVLIYSQVDEFATS